MFKLVILACSLQLLILGTHQACSSSTWYSQFNMTALSTPQTSNFTVCIDTSTQFGSCVDQTSLKNFLVSLNFGLVRAFLAKGSDVLGSYNHLAARIGKLIKNANTIAANATLNATVINSTSSRLLQSNKNITRSKPSAPSTSAGEKGNDTKLVVGNKVGVPLKNVKNMYLNATSIQALTNVFGNLTDFQTYANGYKSNATRQACYSSILSAHTGAVCVLTSGAATSYTNGNSTNPISLSIPQSAAANITQSCVAFIQTRCLIRTARDVLAQVLNQTIPAENANITSVCTALAANPGCTKNGSTCSTDVQALIALRMVKLRNAVKDAFESDMDPQSAEDHLNTLDGSFNQTLSQGGQSSNRRLQTTTTASVDLTVSSTGYDVLSASDNSGLDLTSMETTLGAELPALATSSETTSGSSFKIGFTSLLALGLSVLFLQK